MCDEFCPKPLAFCKTAVHQQRTRFLNSELFILRVRNVEIDGHHLDGSDHRNDIGVARNDALVIGRSLHTVKHPAMLGCRAHAAERKCEVRAWRRVLQLAPRRQKCVVPAARHEHQIIFAAVHRALTSLCPLPPAPCHEVSRQARRGHLHVALARDGKLSRVIGRDRRCQQDVVDIPVKRLGLHLEPLPDSVNTRKRLTG